MGIYETLHNVSVEIPDDLLGVVQEIHRRWPNLKVRYLDPDVHSSITDAPYIIVDDKERVVAQCWQLDQRMIAELARMHEDGKDARDRYHRYLADREAARVSRREEAKAKRVDLLEHLVSSPRVNYTFTDDEGNVKRYTDDPTRKPIEVVKNANE